MFLLFVIIIFKVFEYLFSGNADGQVSQTVPGFRRLIDIREGFRRFRNFALPCINREVHKEEMPDMSEGRKSFLKYFKILCHVTLFNSRYTFISH